MVLAGIGVGWEGWEGEGGNWDCLNMNADIRGSEREERRGEERRGEGVRRGKER